MILTQEQSDDIILKSNGECSHDIDVECKKCYYFFYNHHEEVCKFFERNEPIDDNNLTTDMRWASVTGAQLATRIVLKKKYKQIAKVLQ